MLQESFLIVCEQKISGSECTYTQFDLCILSGFANILCSIRLKCRLAVNAQTGLRGYANLR